MEIADINLSLLPIINRLFEIIRRQKTKTSVTTFTLSFFPVLPAESLFLLNGTFSMSSTFSESLFYLTFCPIWFGFVWFYLLFCDVTFYRAALLYFWCLLQTVDVLHWLWNFTTSGINQVVVWGLSSCAQVCTHTRLNRKAAQIHSAGKITPIINWSMMSLINCEINTRVKSQRRWPRTVFQVRSLNVLTNVYIRSAQNWKLEEICSSYIIESAT